jgi:putative lipoprotein
MQKTLLLFSLSCATALFAIGCGGGNDGNASGTVTGTVTYLQRMALPPAAEVRVRLEDVSLQDAPAGLIAEETFSTKGKQVPIPFTIKFDRKLIEESHAYSVRAEIYVDGEQRFTTTQTYPVLTRDHPTHVDVIVMALQAEAPANTPLVDTHWTLVELAGRSIAKTPTGREPYLMLLAEDNRTAATGGCNQVSGGYQTSESSLRFSELTSTMKACPDDMERDQALSKALESTRTFAIEGDKLAIMDAPGNVLARFQAAANEE